MPYYGKPQFCKAHHMDRERLIASLRKMNEAVDSFNHYNFIGGEPFLNPDLKFFIEEVPVEKCHLVQVLTNGTIVPDDPELFDVLRRKNVQVVVSQYPSNQEKQKRLIEVLERERVGWHSYSPPWFDYGEPRDYRRSKRELQQQFIDCPGCCRNLLDGKLYYCMRGSHTADLGICDAQPGDAVDLLSNTKAQNKKQIRRMIWCLKPIEACRYCLRGTSENVEIPRGK